MTDKSIHADKETGNTKKWKWLCFPIAFVIGAGGGAVDKKVETQIRFYIQSLIQLRHWSERLVRLLKHLIQYNISLIYLFLSYNKET